jgi:hypothetical protein
MIIKNDVAKEVTVKLFTCEKCGFVKYTPIFKCQLCGTLQRGTGCIKPKEKE